MTPNAPNHLAARIKEEARARDFTLVGIAPADDAETFPHFEEWLGRGYAGEMGYLWRDREPRRHPRSILESVRTVVMVGMEYAERGRANVPVAPLAGPPRGRVAGFAQGPEYHRYVWDRLNDLTAWIEQLVPGCQAHGVADTAPLLERDYARRAGLGWVGKNTMLINPRRGSYVILSAVLTDLVLPPDPPFESTHCGTCTACLDACPTQAFVAPGRLDARRCISYLTIELRSSIPAELREPIGDWVYGCDVCQDVCPWNRRPGGPVAFPRDPALESLDPVELLGLDADAFRIRFKKTSLWRNRRAGLLRNAAIVLGNVGGADAVPALQRALDDPEPLVREAAGWALARVRERTERIARAGAGRG